MGCYEICSVGLLFQLMKRDAHIRLIDHRTNSVFRVIMSSRCFYIGQETKAAADEDGKKRKRRQENKRCPPVDRMLLRSLLMQQLAAFQANAGANCLSINKQRRCSEQSVNYY